MEVFSPWNEFFDAIVKKVDILACVLLSIEADCHAQDVVGGIEPLHVTDVRIYLF
jgi:hypothetical protein